VDRSVRKRPSDSAWRPALPISRSEPRSRDYCLQIPIFCKIVGGLLDLLLFKRGRRIGVECKRSDAPTFTPSMRIALDDLKLDRLVVVYPGDHRYSLGDRVEVIPLIEFANPAGLAQSLFKKPRR
jgi:hypothetical protein